MAKHEVETVTIELDGEEVKLTPSAKAMTKISQTFGGILNAVDSVQRFNVDTMSTVIAAGAAMSDADRETLAKKIFEAGVTEMLVPVTRFLSLLATGGRRGQAASTKAE